MKRRCHLIVFLCMVLCLCAGQVGQAARDRAIRVGISEYPHFAYLDQSGEPTGADVEYIYKIAQYANLPVKIVLIKDAETYFSSLENGSVDILFDAIKTEERTHKYLYAEHESGSTPNSVYVRENDNRFSYGNVQQLKDKVFGSEKDSEVTNVFIKWCEKHGFTPTIKLYADSTLVDKALTNKEIDAGIYGTDIVEGFRTILEFEPLPYYAIFRLDSGALKDKIDQAMTRILAEDPTYKSSLVKKYVVNSRNTYIEGFTEEEKYYIAEHPALRVAVLQHDLPYYGVGDGVGDKLSGILPDYYAKLSSLIRIKFVLVPYASQEDMLADLYKGQADMIGIFSDGLIVGYNKQLLLTSPFATVNGVLITLSGKTLDSLQSVADKRREENTVAANLLSQFQKIKLQPYESTAKGFEAMENSRVDGFITDQFTSTWLMNQNSHAIYSVTPLTTMRFDLCCALKSDDLLLCSILNKAIAVSTDDFNAIVANNTMAENSWRTSIAKLPPSGIVAFAAIMLLLVGALAYALFIQQRSQKEKIAMAAMTKYNQEQQRFFSTISHDMRTPLNAILGFSYMAAQKVISPEVKNYLGKIQISGQLLLDLINDTLTISKISSGTLKLNARAEDFVQLLSSITVAIKEAAEQRHITFTMQNSSIRKTILADRLNVQKILLNILSNAVKYTPEGGHVNFTIADAENGNIVFTVQDDGVGISPAFLPHIYEPFIQENRPDVKAAGTGLGLSIVKQLVDMMQGTIAVTSTVNKGSTFTVKLPFQDATAELAQQQKATKVDLSKLQGKHLLICEDNTLNTEMLLAMLKGKGVTAKATVNGADGVKAFEQSKPGEYNAILMDVRMPVLNGLDATRQIRKLARADAKTIPIIAMTADTFEEDVKRCLDAGMNAHVAKPISPSQFFELLAEKTK